MAEGWRAAAAALLDSSATVATRKAAEAYLKTARQRDDAGALCLAILALPDCSEPEAVLAAQTLLHSIRKTKTPLDIDEAAPPLLNACAAFLHSSSVLTQLALAMAALILRSPLWSANPALLVNVVDSAFAAHPPGSPAALVKLRILAVVPEEIECPHISLAPHLRSEISGALRDHGLPYVCASVLAELEAGANEPMQRACFSCLTSWTTFGGATWEQLSNFFVAALQHVQQHPSVCAQDLVDFVTAVCDVHCTRSDEAHLVIENILSLGELCDFAVPCTLVVNCATAAAPLFMEHHLRELWGVLITLLYQCTEHGDLDIAQKCLGFWEQLCHQARERRFPSDVMLNVFQQATLSLIRRSTLAPRSSAAGPDGDAGGAVVAVGDRSGAGAPQGPRGVGSGGGSGFTLEFLSDVSEYREAVRNTLRSFAEQVPAFCEWVIEEAAAMVHGHLAEASPAGSHGDVSSPTAQAALASAWPTMESVIHVISALYRFIFNTSRPPARMEAAEAQKSLVLALPYLPLVPGLQVTVVTLVGCIGPWIATRLPEFVPSALSIAASSLCLPEEDDYFPMRLKDNHVGVVALIKLTKLPGSAAATGALLDEYSRHVNMGHGAQGLSLWSQRLLLQALCQAAARIAEPEFASTTVSTLLLAIINHTTQLFESFCGPSLTSSAAAAAAAHQAALGGQPAAAAAAAHAAAVAAESAIVMQGLPRLDHDMPLANMLSSLAVAARHLRSPLTQPILCTMMLQLVDAEQGGVLARLMVTLGVQDNIAVELVCQIGLPFCENLDPQSQQVALAFVSLTLQRYFGQPFHIVLDLLRAAVDTAGQVVGGNAAHAEQFLAESLVKVVDCTPLELLSARAPLAEAYFVLMNLAMARLPRGTSPLFHGLVCQAQQLIQHPGPCMEDAAGARAILGFLQACCTIQNDFRAAFQEMLLAQDGAEGERLVFNLLTGVAVSLPSWLLEDIVALIFGLYECFGMDQVEQWMYRCVQNPAFSRASVSDACKMQFLRDARAHASGSRGKFKNLIKQFCGGKKKATSGRPPSSKTAALVPRK
eukprot:m.7918 g.7918  ORF g.7918 m.7918 type:complete len:1051 (-) comp2810_c0_seq1:42-3194(-)